jgi:Uma2 family endonuclease
MTQTARPVSSDALRSERVLPLQNGDHLTRQEFERRWDAMPRLKRAELIEGRVYLSPPTSIVGHSFPDSFFGTILGLYQAGTPGVKVGHTGSVRLDDENLPQPDLFVMILPDYGGQAKIDSDDYLEGAPELTVEIAASSASYDLHEKLRLYQRSGVREYLVWRTREEQIDHFVLRGGQYISVSSNDGMLRSEVFPGLWIDARAFIADDINKAIAGVQKGLASLEHATFVEALKAKAGK